MDEFVKHLESVIKSRIQIVEGVYRKVFGCGAVTEAGKLFVGRSVFHRLVWGVDKNVGMIAGLKGRYVIAQLVLEDRGL